MPPFPSRHGPRWALWLLLIMMVLLCLVLIAPTRPLISVTHDNAGWSLNSRSLADIVRQGFLHVDARFTTPGFNISSLAADSAYCPADVGHGYGPISLHRHYNWERPQDTPDTRKQRMQACRALRADLLKIPGTLSAALIDGDPQKVKAHLDDAMVKKGTLAVTLPEVGQPMRHELANLMLVSADQTLAIKPIDVALAVGDLDHVRHSLPKDGFAGYQRYALFRLDQTRLVEEHPSTASTWGWRRPDPHSQADGFQRSDYYLANAHCDSRYAAFLAAKGITADHQVVLQAFLSRLVHETPGAFRQVDLDYQTRRLPTYNAQATPQDCTALMEQYRSVHLSARQLDTLSRMTGTQMLTYYHAMIARAEQGHTFESREEQWRFDDRQPFNQHSAPLPSLPGMFTTLLKSRPGGPALCAALDVLPWMLGHDQALAAFMALASTWRGQPVDQAYLEDAYQCSPALLLPPSLFERETRERDAFLKQAGLACHLVTPEQKYVYTQRVECSHEH